MEAPAGERKEAQNGAHQAAATQTTAPAKPTGFFGGDGAAKAEGKSAGFFSQVGTGSSAPLFGTGKAVESLFGETSKAGGLFDKPKEAVGGLFDSLKGLGSDKPATGFFGSAAQEPKKSGGLFEGLVNPSASNNTGCGTNLFDTAKSSLTGLFANVAGGGEEEEEGDPNEEVVPGQEDVCDPSKAKANFAYKSDAQVRFQQPVLNFKADPKPALGPGSLSVETVPGKFTCVIFRNGAKVILHQSLLLGKPPASGAVNKRTDALWVDTFEIDADTKKPKKVVCKIAFADDHACADFKLALAALATNSS